MRILGKLLRRPDSTEPVEAEITLSRVEACHCFQALGWLAQHNDFPQIFGEGQFVPAANTLAKLSRFVDPATSKLTGLLLAEADQFAAANAELSENRSQHP